MIAHLSPFQPFIDSAINVCCQDPEAIGLAAGGSWASGELDAYSDLDLVLVLSRKVAPDTEQMQVYASRFGPLLASFRGDHVGEPRLLIALYESPLLHVDIKFLTPDEFYERVENPVILWERDQLLTSILESRWPFILHSIFNGRKIASGSGCTMPRLKLAVASFSKRWIFCRLFATWCWGRCCISTTTDCQEEFGGPKRHLGQVIWSGCKKPLPARTGQVCAKALPKP